MSTHSQDPTARPPAATDRTRGRLCPAWVAAWAPLRALAEGQPDSPAARRVLAALDAGWHPHPQDARRVGKRSRE